MKTSHKKKMVTSADAEEIARMASRGDDVSRFFTNKGRMMPPIQRVNVDFTGTMLVELDTVAKDLNVSRQAVIKSFLRQALDQRHLADAATARPSKKRRSTANT